MGGPQYFFAGSPAGIAAPVTVLGRGGSAVPGDLEPLQVLTTLDDVRQASRRVMASIQGIGSCGV